MRIRALAPTVWLLVAIATPAVGLAGSPSPAVAPQPGTLWGWGGQVAGGFNSTCGVPSPAPIAGLVSGITSVAANGGVVLALKSDGTVWSFGLSQVGAVGQGVQGAIVGPGQVPGLEGVVGVAEGHDHSLALKNDGTVWAWGGPGSTGEGYIYGGPTRPRPVQVAGLHDIVAVAAGDVLLALQRDGSVWTWNDPNAASLRHALPPPNAPIQVPGLSDVTAVATGGSSLALKRDGTVWAWGNNSWGQLGDGTIAGHYLADSTGRPQPPLQVHNLSQVVAVAEGARHSLALTSDGTVWAWGDNSEGKLGLEPASLLYRPTPAPVPGLGGVTAIAAGGRFSLVIRDDGTVWGWGSVQNAELPRTLHPQSLAGGARAGGGAAERRSGPRHRRFERGGLRHHSLIIPDTHANSQPRRAASAPWGSTRRRGAVERTSP
jgi:alpha-tubulin suppressor-like RCC1 family protein